MAMSGSQRNQREIPPIDKQFLCDLGYDVAAYIGRGAFGYVYSGVCNQFAIKTVPIGPNEPTDSTQVDPISGNLVREVTLNGKPCAIKVFHNTKRWTDSLYNEAKFLCDLNHQNIVEIYLVCKSETNIYLVMEYLNGGTLKELLESVSSKSILDDFSSLQMIRQLTSGLQYLHSQNIVHGDLHKDNIMIKVENDEVIFKIVDFGNSRQLQHTNHVLDMFKLAGHMSDILKKTQFIQLTQLQQTDINKVIDGILKQTIKDINQAMNELSRFFPPSHMPYPPESAFKRLTEKFKK